MSTSDLELLAKYSRQGAEDAFAEVVRRHAGLVYTTALRVTRTPQLAEDVVQAVFLDLARNAKKLRPDTVLATWLYTVTRYIAANTVRGETRRLIREQAAYAMTAAEETPSPSADLEPLLDDALEALAEADRSAIILRFFEDKCLADVGAALGVSANAAQKRVNRAVEQMRGFFTQRGIAAGTLSVTALLTANAKAAPVGLVTNVCTTVHSTLPLTTATLIKAATMTTLQKSLVGLTLVTAVGVAIRQTHEVTQLREQLRTTQASSQDAHSSQSEATAPDHAGTRSVTAKTGANHATTQIEAQLQSLAELGAGKFGHANLKRLIASVSVEDIPRLLPLVDEKLPNQLRMRFHEDWIERWAAADAPAAFAYAVRLDNQDAAAKANPNSYLDSASDSAAYFLRSSALNRVFQNWAEQDQAGASKALEAYKGPNREEAIKALASTWLEKDPKTAMDWAMHNLPRDLEGTRDLALKWVKTDPAEAWKWAQALPDGEAKQNFTHALAPEAANALPADAAQKVSEMEPGDDQNRAATHVAERWAKTDPVAASKWAAQFPDAEWRSMTMGRIASRWGSQDPAAARSWVQSLPEGDERNEGLRGLIEGLTPAHPEQAAEIQPSLPDDGRRLWFADKIGRSWLKTDPAAARKWLLSSGYDERMIKGLEE